MGAKANKADLMDQPATAGETEGTTEAKEPKAKREPKAPKPKTKLGIKFLRPFDASIDRLNNQQKVLMDAMVKLADKDGVVDREALLNEVTSESLKSRQPAERVLGFYMNTWKKDVVKGEGEKARTIPALLSIVNVAA